MKRILALLGMCLLLAGCAAQNLPVMVPPVIHTAPPTTQSTHPAKESAPTEAILPDTVPTTLPETVPVTVPETLPPETTETLPPETTETLPPVTEPGPQTVVAEPGSLELTAQSAFVYDCETGDLWVWGNMDAKIAPASLVKLFTIHVAMEYLDPDSIITAGAEVDLVQEGSSVAAIGKGNRLSVRMLVEGCLVQSGNDAAYVLAAAAGRKLLQDPNANPREAVAAFMKEMNRKAAALGLSNTYYVNPDGFDAPGQYTSPADVLTVAKLSVQDPLVLEYCGISQDRVIFESGQDYIWYSTNFLLHKNMECYCPDAFGLKTGTTSQAGAHLLAAFHAPGRDLIIGVFGCPDKQARFEEALLLYELSK